MRILHLEDDSALQKVVARGLKRHLDAAVTTVARPGDAITALQLDTFDIIVSDYNVIDGTGQDLLDWVRANRPSQPFVFLSDDELSSQADALKTQVADLQAKPGADKAQAKVKKTMLLVVSATDFSYDIGDGLRATPDVPVKAERYEGNLLDSQMKAGYVVEYKAD